MKLLTAEHLYPDWRVDYPLEGQGETERQNVYHRKAGRWFGFSSVYTVPHKTMWIRRGFFHSEPLRVVDDDALAVVRRQHFQYAAHALTTADPTTPEER